MRVITRWGVVLASLLLAFFVWAQGLVICGKCGREAASGATVCAHCQAELPKPKVVVVPQAAAVVPATTTTARTEGGEVGTLAATVVEDSVRQARELEAHQPEVALYYWQNALALMRLVPVGRFPESVSQLILNGNKSLLQKLQQGSVPCRKCGGTGYYQLDTSKVTGKAGVIEAKGMACKSCDGRGRVPGPRALPEFKALVLKGRTEFENRQVVAGWVRVGRAMVPTELDKVLTTTQRALVMTAMPTPCAECVFSGRESCNSCRGSGWQRCNYPNCRDGVLEVRATARAARRETRMNQEAVERCPRCNGLGEIACDICKGVGSVVCRKCGGSGLAKECPRCSATGLVTCQKCRGSGEVRGAPCPDCKGERVMLCTSCRGEGAVAR